MAEVQLAGFQAALDLQPHLAVAVVEHDLVVAGAAEFLALEAAERGGVAMVVFAAAGAMPGGRVAPRQVGLGAGRGVAGRGIDLRIGLPAVAAARRDGRAALAAAVVQRAHDDGLVHVVVQEAHQHLLADARHEAHAHARARLALRHAGPAALCQAFIAIGLPMEADAHVAALVAQNLVAALGLHGAVGAGHDGRVHAMHGRRAAQTRAARLRQGRTPGAVAAHGLEAVGVADLARLGQHGGVGLRQVRVRTRCAGRRKRLRIQRQVRVQSAQALRQRGAGLGRQVVDADVLDPVQREDRLEALFARRSQRRHVLQGEAGAGTERAHTSQADEGLRAGLHRFDGQVGLAPGLGLVGEAAMARHLVPFQPGLFATVGGPRQRFSRHGALAAVVPAQDRDAVGAAPPLAHHGLHGVARFGRACAVKAHTAAGGLGVFCQAAAVGKDQHHVPRGHFWVFDHRPAQARLDQQAADEVIVGFAVLRGVGARRHAGQRLGRVGAHAMHITFVATQHVADDVQHGTRFEHAAVALLRGQPQPRRDRQAVARQSGVAGQQLGFTH
ncbi:hypothetical protein LMG26858_06301 [Achromobacter anxifer]|uniref:Uncharacterized protein n=1 Tax=Achromobacter anxifer TaxID=1287737 RepID=A0A6S7EV28_9BURK|nr:hypothetical protein LMG26858_06301 [Achromobacter anxifer]